MTVLLDANVLIALSVPQHIHHVAADTWLAAGTFTYATCTTTQGTLMRYLTRERGEPFTAVEQLHRIEEHPRHTYWEDTVRYTQINLAGVIGHRQVTDAYLAGLARAHQGQIATFDKGLAVIHSDVAILIPEQNRS